MGEQINDDHLREVMGCLRGIGYKISLSSEIPVYKRLMDRLELIGEANDEDAWEYVASEYEEEIFNPYKDGAKHFEI